MSTSSATVPTVVTTPAPTSGTSGTSGTPASTPAATSSIPAWMNVKNSDGSFNMAGLFFWLVMVALLFVVLQWSGLAHNFFAKKAGVDASGKGEDFYSDL